jgi:hypothetical protein
MPDDHAAGPVTLDLSAFRRAVQMDATRLTTVRDRDETYRYVRPLGYQTHGQLRSRTIPTASDRVFRQND